MPIGFDPWEALTRSPTLGLSEEQRRFLRRGSLWVLLASLGLSALIGIIAILGDEFGETQGRLVLTTLSAFGASAVTLSCGLAWERGRLGAVPLIGIVCGLIGFAVVFYAIWWQPDFESDFWWKTYFSEIMVAVAATHASLIGVAGMLRRNAWASYTAYGLNFLAACLTLVGIWAEVESGGFWRFYGVVMVLLVANTIAVPVLRRLEGPPRDEASPELAPSPEPSGTPARFCPACGANLEHPGADVCLACGARFEVRITPR